MNDHANLLGRLQPVELRRIWTSEAGDFTPWLARDENLALLGETIGIELELEADHRVFAPRVNQLKASKYENPEDLED